MPLAAKICVWLAGVAAVLLISPLLRGIWWLVHMYICYESLFPPEFNYRCENKALIYLAFAAMFLHCGLLLGPFFARLRRETRIYLALFTLPGFGVLLLDFHMMFGFWFYLPGMILEGEIIKAGIYFTYVFIIIGYIILYYYVNRKNKINTGVDSAA